jgi:hypothetical protein
MLTPTEQVELSSGECYNISRLLFMSNRTRICALAEAPLVRAIALLNTLSDHIGIFHADYYDVVDLVESNEWEFVCTYLNV